jgi:hypothetical protein
MTEKPLPMGGGWAAQQKRGIEKQSKAGQEKRAADPQQQTEVVDQEALVASADQAEDSKEHSSKPQN